MQCPLDVEHLWDDPGLSRDRPRGSKRELEGPRELRETSVAVAVGTSPTLTAGCLTSVAFGAEQTGAGRVPSVLLRCLVLPGPEPVGLGLLPGGGAKRVISSRRGSGNFDKSVRDVPKMTPAAC